MKTCIFCSVYANVADDSLRRKRVRNRWYKMVTLVNNRSLVAERFVKLYQQEMDSAADVDDEERIRSKVTETCIYKKY